MNALDILVVIVRNLVIVLMFLSLVPGLVWLERKGSAYIQDRPGPERAAVGPFRLFGALHLLADAIKFIGKEDVRPTEANRFYYVLAPIIAAMVPFLTAAIVPFFDSFRLPNGTVIGGQMLNLNVGILWFFAIVSLSVYGVIFAGWASANKFSLLGGMRASAAVLSYEIPMGLAALSAILAYGTVNLPAMVHMQAGTWWHWLPKWGIFTQPLAALIFTVCAFAETNRIPFDLAEAEGELVAGYHTEYSSLKFAMFYLAEYVALLVSTSLIVTMFFGGWQVPWLDTAALSKHFQPILEWSFGIGFALSLVVFVLCLQKFQNEIGRWKDMRDYEGLILALLVIGGGLTALLLLFVCLAFTLPAWVGPIFAAIAQFGIFMAKVLFLCWIFVWVRWTIPRFRYDQVMNLGWKTLLPLALLNILVTGLVIMWVK